MYSIVGCFVDSHVDNAARLVYGGCIIVYTDTVVGKVQVRVGEAGNVNDTAIFEYTAVGCINRCRFDIRIVFLGLCIFAGIEIIGGIITARNHTMIFSCTACSAYGQAVEGA